MKIRQAVRRYITHKQALDVEFEDGARQLHSFCDAVGNIDLDRVQPKAVSAFINNPKRSALTCARYRTMLAGLYSFALARGYATHSPVPIERIRPSSRFTPYIYSHDDLRRLLDAVEASQWHGHCRLHHRTLRVLLIVLYGCGLRIGEALRLTAADVDLTGQLLIIRQTKFDKSRLVPIGRQVTDALRRYAENARHQSKQSGTNVPFFTTLTGTPISVDLADRSFYRLRRKAGIRRAGTYQPRLHDLRHTFAVHRLLSWYRHGRDVQALLPHLSTYLGHLNLTGTQRYLTLTPELAAQAADRFEHYATCPEHSYERERPSGPLGTAVPHRIFGHRAQFVPQHPAKLPRRTTPGTAVHGQAGA